jgi:hypothetical protein
MIIKIGEAEWHELQRKITMAPPGECEHKRLKWLAERLSE